VSDPAIERRHADDKQARRALIHRYQPSARELWKFCGRTASQWLTAARTIEYLGERGEELPDWWAVGEPRRRG
jgi:hypothetical protein